MNFTLPTDLKKLNIEELKRLADDIRAEILSVVKKNGGHLASNLGVVELPEVMASYVERLDFILSPQSTAPYNCGTISYGGQLQINFIRNIKKPMLEAKFAQVLLDMGLPVQVQSNRG